VSFLEIAGIRGRRRIGRERTLEADESVYQSEKTIKPHQSRQDCALESRP
jgi:hypothetical protein